MSSPSANLTLAVSPVPTADRHHPHTTSLSPCSPTRPSARVLARTYLLPILHRAPTRHGFENEGFTTCRAALSSLLLPPFRAPDHTTRYLHRHLPLVSAPPPTDSNSIRISRPCRPTRSMTTPPPSGGHGGVFVSASRAGDIIGRPSGDHLRGDRR